MALEKAVLGKNKRFAEQNRSWFEAKKILALNLVSSPGAGKTTLLERTLTHFKGRIPMSVIEGDQSTTRDAERIRATGVSVVQVNTGTACHLDAEMVQRSLSTLAPSSHSVLWIENVGNLVCPALFDLGERVRLVVASVTEGEDKPVKYSHLFRSAQWVVLNKMDLLPHVDFSVERFTEYLRLVNPLARILKVSATQKPGLEASYHWIGEIRRQSFDEYGQGITTEC